MNDILSIWDRLIAPQEGDDALKWHLPLLAERLINLRKLRNKHLDPSFFGEPAWDILLDLYVSQHSARDVSISSACLGAGAPNTTGLRWLAKLEQDGLIERRDDQFDRRRAYVRLSTEGERRVVAYLYDAAASLGYKPS